MRNFLFRALATSASVSAIVLSLSPISAAAETPAPSADWGKFGVQTQWIDPAADPGDDFDAYVNGKWNATVELPADRTSWGSFIELRELSEQRLHGIMDELLASNPAPGTDAARLQGVHGYRCDQRCRAGARAPLP